MPLFWVMERQPVSYEKLSALISGFDISFQKTLQNSAGSPSEPAVFPVSMVFKAARHSFSVKEPSQVVLVQDRVVFMPEEVRWID